MDCSGIREEIIDEDGVLFESEIWFVGELGKAMVLAWMLYVHIDWWS